MLVSAISNGQGQSLRALNNKHNLCASIQNRVARFREDEPAQSSEVSKNREAVFASINDWRSFCHNQIANGKLDVVV